MTWRRAFAIVGVIAAGAVGIVAGLIAYHGIHEDAYDKCLLTPPWYDLPAQPVDFDIEWDLFPPDSSCVFTLPDGTRVERDWTEPPWDKLPARGAANALELEEPGVVSVSCLASPRLDYECRYRDGRRVWVAVDRFYITEKKT